MKSGDQALRELIDSITEQSQQDFQAAAKYGEKGNFEMAYAAMMHRDGLEVAKEKAIAKLTNEYMR